MKFSRVIIRQSKVCDDRKKDDDCDDCDGLHLFFFSLKTKSDAFNVDPLALIQSAFVLRRMTYRSKITCPNPPSRSFSLDLHLLRISARRFSADA